MKKNIRDMLISITLLAVKAIWQQISTNISCSDWRGCHVVSAETFFMVFIAE